MIIKEYFTLTTDKSIYINKQGVIFMNSGSEFYISYLGESVNIGKSLNRLGFNEFNIDRFDTFDFYDLLSISNCHSLYYSDILQ